MKNLIVGLLFISIFQSCKNSENEPIDVSKYESFGAKISAENALSSDALYTKIKDLKEGDTLDVKFSSKINSVCQKKGCWMRLELPENNEAFVKFKDYAFFVPLNATSSDVIVNGKAYVSVESVEELKHYAKDAGKPESYINAIVQPEITYSIMADGVLIKK